MIERQIIDCACGCGMLLEDRDQWSHKRRFVNGHNSRMRTTEDRKRIAESVRASYLRDPELRQIHGTRLAPFRFPKADGHPSWNGGRTVRRYVYLYRPEHPRANSSGYVAEHRLVMEELLGRFLQPQEVVHHIDCNPHNNDPSLLAHARKSATPARGICCEAKSG